MNMISDVREFHDKFGQPVLGVPTVPDMDRVALRLALVAEEFCELCEATGSQPRSLVEGYKPELSGVDIVAVADAIADLIYVAVGTAHEFGIPLGHVWNAVQESNMRKEGGPARADGKILKPEGWKAPDIAGILRAHGWQP